MTRKPRIIVAIGGGSIGKPGQDSTSPIDKEIIALSTKKKPSLLFIPTASSDDESYIKAMKMQYERLHCTVRTLLLIREKPSTQEIQKKIHAADIIYIGGGNTLKMMRLWRRLGVDTLLKEAYTTGTVMCGVSAGSICWFEYGHSDSMSYYNPKKWNYIRVKGLGLIKGIHCPHYDSDTNGKKRRTSFQKFMKKFPQTGIAVDNCAAIAFVDDTYKILATKKTAHVFVLKTRGGKAVEQCKEKKKLYEKIEQLYKL